MSPAPSNPPTHPEDLLPWFVNDSLGPSERRVVEDHLEGCQSCQKEVALLVEVRNAAKEISSPSAGEFVLNRLLREVRMDRGSGPKAVLPAWKRLLAIAACIIIALQTGLLIHLTVLSPSITTLGQQGVAGIIQVSFAPSAQEAEIRKLVQSVNGRFIDGPGEFGVYRIQLPLSDETQVQSILHIFHQRQDLVTHASKE